LKILFLGLNPSRRLGKSPSLKTLNIWIDELKIQYYSFDNIYPGYNSFSLKDIKKEYLREIVFSYDKVLALGSKVSDILDLMGINHFKLPHPSGLNRQLNNKTYIYSTLRSCKNYLEAT